MVGPSARWAPAQDEVASSGSAPCTSQVCMQHLPGLAREVSTQRSTKHDVAMTAPDTHSSSLRCSRTQQLYSRSRDVRVRHVIEPQICTSVRYATDRSLRGTHCTASFYQSRSRRVAVFAPQGLQPAVRTAPWMIASSEIVAALKGMGRVCSRLECECTMRGRGDLCIGGFAY